MMYKSIKKGFFPQFKTREIVALKGKWEHYSCAASCRKK